MTEQMNYTFPVNFDDVHYLASLYTGHAEKITSLLKGTGLKAGLHFFGKPVVALGLIQYKVSDLGAYNEMIIALPVVREHEPSSWRNWLDLYAPVEKRTGGQYIIHIPVTTQQSVDAGRNLWGYPKTLLPITHQFSKNKIETHLYDNNNQSLLQVVGKLGPSLPIPTMHLMTYSFLQNQLLKTTVNVHSTMKWRLGSTLSIHVEHEHHPITKDLIELGVVNKSPLFTIESTHFKAQFNEGQQIS